MSVTVLLDQFTKDTSIQTSAPILVLAPYVAG